MPINFHCIWIFISRLLRKHKIIPFIPIGYQSFLWNWHLSEIIADINPVHFFIDSWLNDLLPICHSDEVSIILEVCMDTTATAFCISRAPFLKKSYMHSTQHKMRCSPAKVRSISIVGILSARPARVKFYTQPIEWQGGDWKIQVPHL